MQDRRVVLDGRRDLDTDLSASPWWIGAVFKMGIPAAFAAFLIYFLAEDVRTAAKEHTAQLIKVQVQISALAETERAGQAMLGFYLRGLCLNQANTEAKRANCTP